MKMPLLAYPLAKPERWVFKDMPGLMEYQY
jgi:hypothetical protein